MFRIDKFPGQEPNEKIVMVLHRHWFVFLSNALRLGVLALVPLFLGIAWKLLSNWVLLPSSFSYVLVVMFGGLYYLFLLMLAFGFWIDYYLDVFVITDRRVVDIEQSGLFNRSIAELRMYRIQDVTSEVKGFWATILRFGNVYIQTAAEKERFIFEQVAHPELVVKTLLSFTDKIDDKIERTPIQSRPPTTI